MPGIVKSEPIKSNLKFKKLSETRKLQWRGPVRVGREHVGATPGAISRRFEPGSCPGSSEGGGGAVGRRHVQEKEVHQEEEMKEEGL